MNQSQSSDVTIDAGEVTLDGTLTIPSGVRGVVVFAHGSGSSRFSPRNRQVAQYLVQRGFGTLLFDLLTEEENREDEINGRLRFDIPLLSRRLEATVLWMQAYGGESVPALGLFGASTGAAAALRAAAAQPSAIAAVVSRGGRPDLAGDALARVKAPTLLLVGGWDETVLLLNQRAAEQLRCERAVVVVPGATHLFEEEGKLEEVCRHAAGWFDRYFPATRDATGEGRP